MLFAIDRAGAVGADGATHQGAFDISFLRTVPHIVIATPSDERECRLLLTACYEYEGAAAVRYPRGAALPACEPYQAVEIGTARSVRQGTGVAFLAFGTALHIVAELAEELNATLLDMRFVKPLDQRAIIAAARVHHTLVTLEENAKMGGAGSAVLEVLVEHNLHPRVLRFGFDDEFIAHASATEQRHACGLTAAAIKKELQCP